MWNLAYERLEVRDLSQVTPDTIREMMGLLENYKTTTAKGYLAHFGSFIEANTGRNPFIGTFIEDRHRDPVDRAESRIVGNRFQDELSAYIYDMKRRGLKGITIKSNIQVLVNILDFMDSLRGNDWTLSQVDVDFIVSIRMSYNVSEKYCKLSIEVLRRFVRFVTGLDPLRMKLNWNCCDEYADRKFITIREFRILMDAANPELKLILCLGALMGLRRGEIANIRLKDICGDTLTIRGKGHGSEGKVVRARIPSSVQNALSEYMPYRQAIIDRYGDNSEGYLLIQNWKTKGCRMSPDTVSHRVRMLGRKCGVDLSAHSLRRLYATTMADAGEDLDTIRRMMRHAHTQTTSICYIKADPRRLAHASDAVESLIFG